MAARALIRGRISAGGLCGGALWLLALLQCAAATGASGTRVAIRVQPERWPHVRCSTLVTDAAGVPISGLAKEDFSVSEDGRAITEFRVLPFRLTQEKMAVALVIDRSGSMQGKPFAKAREAAANFASRLAETDVLAVVTFGGRSRTEGPLTTDKGAALAILDQAQSRGRTALYDAVRRAITSLSHYSADQKAVIALTDGHDNASRATSEQCADTANSAGVVLYSIGLGRSVNEKALRAMADRSGGSFFAVASPTDLTAVYQQIAGQIRNRYEIAYTSPHKSVQGPWVTVRISVKDSDGLAAAQAQYLAIGGTATGVAEQGGLGVGGYAALALVVVNLALIGLVVRRRIVVSGPEPSGKPSRCPKCGSQSVARIAYGLPARDHVYDEDVILGGCVVGDHCRDWACKDCAHTWGLGIQQRLRKLREDHR